MSVETQGDAEECPLQACLLLVEFWVHVFNVCCGEVPQPASKTKTNTLRCFLCVPVQGWA